MVEVQCFEWDSNKAKINFKKHSVSFYEAESVFSDEYAHIITDPDHSEKEDRFVILGMSYQLNLLVVSHCYRKNDKTIRIISARKATKNESKFYGDHL